MKRWTLAVAVALPTWAALMAPVPSEANELLQVTGYIDTNGTINVYDRDGQPLGKRSVGELPPPPVPVLEANEDRGLYRIQAGQDDVWVTKTVATLNHAANVLLPCQQVDLVATNPAGPISRGLSSSCGEGR